MNRLLYALRHAIDAQLNAVTAGNAAAAGRHSLFLLGQFAVAAGGLAALPIWLAVDPAGTPIAALVVLWILAPLATAVFVLHTGRLIQGQMVATLALVSLVLWLCTVSGGLGSPLVFLFAFVPLAALLSATPKAVTRATMVSFAGLVLCASISVLDLNGGSMDWRESAQAGILALMLIGLTAALVARFLVARPSLPTPVGSEVSLGDAGDLITVHNRSGDVTSASAVVRELLGVGPEQLNGRGMADLVHIEDRPRFDAALHRACAEATRVRLAYRIRTENLAESGGTWVESTFRGGLASSGPMSIIGVTRDVSHWRQQDPTHILASGSASDQQVNADLRASIDAVVSLSDRLADPRLVVAGEEYRGYVRLIHSASTQLAAILGSGERSGMDANSNSHLVGSGIIATLQSAIDLAIPRDIKCLVEPTLESASAYVAIPQSDCLRLLVDILVVAKQNFSRENGMILAVDVFEGALRVRIGATASQPFVQRGPAYLRRVSLDDLGLKESAATIANWGGKLTIEMDAPNRSFVTLVLPASAVQQVGDGDLDWRESAEEQKSA